MLAFARIPDVSTASDGKSTFTVYNVHLNGFYHSSLRYSQALELYNELKVNFDTSRLEEFPPKHWRSLSGEQQAQRRAMLERFIQSVCQNRVIGPSDRVKEFFLGAQKACSDVADVSREVDVYLVNGKKVSVTVDVSAHTHQLLEQVCLKIELNPDFTYYFGLFLEREETPSESVLICPLTDYHSPVLTLNSVNKGEATYRITLRQCFWESSLIPALVGDRVAKNLLYIEALYSVAKGYTDITMEMEEQLAAMKSKGQKKEYLECIATAPQFGYRQLEGFTFNHPSDGLTGCVRVGKQEVTTYTGPIEGGRGWKQCQQYFLNRIKSWKIGYEDDTYWLKLDCQISANEFAAVCVTGDNAVFLSLCLHSTVNELLRIRAGHPIRSPASEPIRRTLRDFPHVIFTCNDPTNDLERVTSSCEDQSPPPSIEPTTEETKSSSGSIAATAGGVVPPRDVGVSLSQEGGVGMSANQPKKSKKASSKVAVSNSENPTFSFGTDDDL